MEEEMIGTEGTPRVSTLAHAQCHNDVPSWSHYVLEPNDARIVKIGHNSFLVRLDQIGGGGAPAEEITTVTQLRPTFFDYLAEPPNDRIDFTITVNRTLHWISSTSSNAHTLGPITDPPLSHSFSLPLHTFFSNDCSPIMERQIRFANVLPLPFYYSPPYPHILCHRDNQVGGYPQRCIPSLFSPRPPS